MVSQFVLELLFEVGIRINDGLEQDLGNLSVAALRWKDGFVIEGELDELYHACTAVVVGAGGFHCCVWWYDLQT